MKNILCVPKVLTPTQEAIVVRRSVEINPANALETRTVMRSPIGRRGGPRRLALLVGNRWPESGVKLSVQFLDSPSRALRNKILLHMNAWSKSANIHFSESEGVGQVRIARLDSPPDMAGYWSYVGTQILGIDEAEPTFNLDSFTIKTSEEEFTRVVRHEAGHTLGFEHEHLRSDLVKKIDIERAVRHFKRTDGWTREETIAQVLTPLAKKSIMGTTESDPTSIMCYEIPASITKDRKPIVGGNDINQIDYDFAAKIYPKPTSTSSSSKESTTAESNLPPTTPPPPSVTTSTSDRINKDSVDSSISRIDHDVLQIVIMDDFDSDQPKLAKKPTGGESKSDHERPKYARVFATYGGARVTNAMLLRGDGPGATTSYGKIIQMHERIKNYTNRDSGTLPSDQDLIQFGSDLFETLFQGEVRRLYDEARSRQQNRKLDIVLTSMIDWIAEKPWEFAYDATRDSFLATEEVHLIRNVLTAVPACDVLPEHGPLRILVAAAQPIGEGSLSTDEEIQVIRRGFEPLVDAEIVTIDVIPRATPGRMLSRLSTGNYHIVHIIGHGTFDEITEQGVLLFEDEAGGKIPLSARSVREIFCKRGVSLVFLNSCQSGSGGRHHFNRGVAQSLVSHGMPAVVANQYSVLDTSATTFAQHFYWALAQGMTLGQSACDARIAVNCSMQGELIDWAVPVIYARDPNLTLSVKSRVAEFRSMVPVRREARRLVRGRQVRVAVWDIDSCFPMIDETFKKMNDAQSVFGFELVALSAPIDAWDLENRAEDGKPYLWAEKLAHRLQSMTVELRVNVLACITKQWLRDDGWYNLYGWWPTGQKPPVMIFSCAGFDAMASQGEETDRAIANWMVTGLAGFLADMESHETGAKNCPLSFNEDRELSHLINRQSFDRSCRAQLQQKIPSELIALEALLKTF